MINEIKAFFRDKESLYCAYMPFIKGGGLFIRTQPTYALGSHVSLHLQLPDESIYQSTGKMVWVTPKEAEGHKPAGVGIQFTGDNKQQLCQIIEAHLADMLNSEQITDTI